MFLERRASLGAHHAHRAQNNVASGHLATMIPLMTGPPDNGVIDRLERVGSPIGTELPSNGFRTRRSQG